MPRVTNIQIRRGLSTEWTTQVLSDGEIGFETNTGKFKIGSGGVAWNALEYATDTSNFAGVLGSANGGTGVNNGSSTLALSGSTAIGSSNHTVNIATTANTSVTLPTSGTLLSDPLTIAQGSTGTQYGTSLVGQAMLTADRLKPTNNATCEPIFVASNGTSVQYMNTDLNTMYFFEGTLVYAKPIGTLTALPMLRIYSVDVTTPATLVTEQSSGIFGTVQNSATTIVGTFRTTVGQNANGDIGMLSGTAVAGVVTWTIKYYGFIKTNASTASKIAIGAGQTSANTSAAATFTNGSYLNIYKIGSGSASLFGNWS